MRFAVIGATGTVGRPTANLLEQAGHEVLRLSRHSTTHPVDVSTGTGLAEILVDVDVVISAANTIPPKSAEPVLLDGTRHLLEASDAHHVCVSIVGIEHIPYSYYKTKLAQEELVKRSGRPYTIVRATQFYELVGNPLRKLAKLGLELRSRAVLQPVNVDDAAQAIAAVAQGAARNTTLTISGPEVLTITQLRAGRGIPLPLPLPPKLGRALRAGGLCEANPDFRGTRTYADWLAAQS